MQVHPIGEQQHNTAMLTLTAERSELLYCRAQVQEMARMAAELEQAKKDLEIANAKIGVLELKLAQNPETQE